VIAERGPTGQTPGTIAHGGRDVPGILPGMPGRVTSPRFVGRRDELAAVVDMLDRAAAADPVHLLVGGEAGVGKTRLVDEAITLATSRGFKVLRGHAVGVGDAGLPYGPVVELLRGFVQDVGGGEARGLAGRAAADLARLVPAFGSGPGDAPVQAEWAQTRLFEALLGLLERLAARTPVLVVIEDLHWADSATREALAFLIGGLRGVPVLVIATYRTDELHRRHPLLPWLAELERCTAVHRVLLERLDREAIGELLGSILGGAAPARLVDDVFARSDGNPFFAEELLAASPDGVVARRLPPTLREILLAHIARLPDAGGSALSAAAVAGRRVEHGLLAQVAGLPEPQLLDGLRAAVAAHLLVVESTEREDRYAFRHALVQEAVYDELLPGERRRLHRAIAEALEAGIAGVPGESPDAGRLTEVAHHWALAREDEQAFAASLAAADASLASFAFESALTAYETTLDLWPRIADPEARAGVDHADLHRRAGVAAYLAGDYRRAAAHRQDAVDGVDPVADPRRAGMLREQLARALYVIGDISGSLDEYRAAVATIPAQPPTPERARALSGLGQILMLLARFRESRPLCEEAVAMARAADDIVQEGHARNTLGFDLVMLGRPDEGIAEMRAALRIARDAAVPDDIGRAYVNLGEALDASGRTAEALQTTTEGMAVATEVGIGFSYGAYIRLGGVAFAYGIGQWDTAARLLGDGLANGPVGTGAVAYRLPRTLPFLVGSGDWGRADAAIDEALGLAQQDRGAQFTGPVHAAIAERALWGGDPSAALDAVERGLTYLAPTNDRLETARLCRMGAWAVADLHEQARAHKDPAAATDAGARMAGLRDRLRVAVEADGWSNPLLEAERLTLAAEAGRLEDRPAPASWRTAAAAWDAAERPYLAAYARWRECEAALAEGATGEAASALRGAHATADRLGAAPLREAVATLARRARIDLGASGATRASAAPPATADGDPFGLTPREREVLTLVADGRTNRQVAAALFISESTAGVHVSNILGKLGVGSRTEAAALAYRLRLVGQEAEPPAGG
jgi:DNA-binding NarL/FixJ family response regulator